ncbi:hypothetical protein N7492_001483 [Penicillium capsulatum]|uniref:Uncharacterized protein n=1 Tax=Penicillium capsulatum TaxID=69766 RepID=A0A9W9ITW4_9EURO|nr:hypothetical protein N7492_001483 [Penicillium capsulatum]KAJ6129463.1 hypothetical protein N7512_002243 [Penicillium capsulatum]
MTWSPTANTSLEKKKTDRSPKLGRIMAYFRNQKQQLFSFEDLSQLGLTVLSLPGADFLLASEGPFRPHPTLEPNIAMDDYCREQTVTDDPGHEIGPSIERVARIVTEVFAANLKAKGYYRSEDMDNPWVSLCPQSPFYGIVDGLWQGAKFPDEYDWANVLVQDRYKKCPRYLPPQISETLSKKPPHIMAYLHNGCLGEARGLFRIEMRVLITLINNCVYQHEFEDETIFPVLLFCGYGRLQARIIEAVFDQARETGSGEAQSTNHATPHPGDRQWAF